jgi:endonuclease-3
MVPETSLKRSRSSSLSSLSDEKVPVSKGAISPPESKKLKLQSSHALSSPFPNFSRPTPTEAQEVYDLLSKHHRVIPARQVASESSNAANSCGNVRNVIESLIGTILSQNTSNQNSTRAKKSLDDTFGRNDFAAIAEAPRADVVEAIKRGGLANKKAANIQNLLSSIRAAHDAYSLQHLTSSTLSDWAIMKELMSYDGVGPKTASCVLLFCLGRDSFAVDTHVFRLSKVLGWVPEKADRVTTQGHLDLRIPAELKYGLHVLMVKHGRECKGCKRIGNAGGGKCVLKEWAKGRKGVKKEMNEDDGEGRVEGRGE